jgi:hypothetical protein
MPASRAVASRIRDTYQFQKLATAACFRLMEHRFKGEWYFSTPTIFEALADTDRTFNPEHYPVSA